MKLTELFMFYKKSTVHVTISKVNISIISIRSVSNTFQFIVSIDRTYKALLKPFFKTIIAIFSFKISTGPI